MKRQAEINLWCFKLCIGLLVSSVCYILMMREEPQDFFIKNITLTHLFSKGVEASVMWERDRPYHASSLDHTTMRRSPPVLARGLLDFLQIRFSLNWFNSPESGHWIKTNTDWDSHVCISIYHFIRPTISDELRDYFRLFTQVQSI